MTRYLMTVHGPLEIDEFSSYGSAEARDAAYAETEKFNETLKAEGYWVFGGGLMPAPEAKVVDGQSGTTLITDGPYLESKEHLAGFWLLEVPDDATAYEIAARASVVCQCRIEVRAFGGYA
ncbi:MAG: YciI family protein [Marmoricola sp.]